MRNCWLEIKTNFLQFYGTLHLTGAVLLERADVRRIAGGLIIDVWEGALLISPRLGYDRKFEQTFLEVGLGMGF